MTFMHELAPMILTVKHLSVAFPGRTLFRDVNFDVGEREIVVIKSRVLDGATTLLKSLIGLVNVAEGEVWFDGDDLLQLRGTDRLLDIRRRIGLVYEKGGLVSLLTIFENIALPLLYHTDISDADINKKVLAVAERLGIEDTLDLEPNELNDVQTRLVNLARALALEPRLLLVDELEGGMSEDECATLVETLREFQQDLGFGMVMTTVDDDAGHGTSTYRIEEYCLVPDS